MQFMNSSLEKLVKSLSDNDSKYLSEEFGSENLELFKQKDTCAYEYMDSFKRFGEETLPDQKRFYSSVKDGTTGDNGKKLDGQINDEDYLTCKKIWNKFNRKNMGIITIIIWKKIFCYNIFEKFIATCFKFYGLDPCQYFSSPALSWDAKLNMTGMKLEKIVDIDMYLVTEKGWRGGIFYIAKIWRDSNNKYMKNYDPKKPSKFITYLDMNNLYGWAMSSYLPYGRFKWLKNW